MHEKGEKNHPFLLQCSSGVSWALKKVKETGEKQKAAQRIPGKKLWCVFCRQKKETAVEKKKRCGRARAVGLQRN